MNLFNFFKQKKDVEIDTSVKINKGEKQAYAIFNSIDSTYDGETDGMQFGDTHIYEMDYYTLRARSRQLYAENDIVKMIISRLVTFTIGSGLKLQAEPYADIIEQFGRKIDVDNFEKQVESFWDVYSKSKYIDYTNQKNLGGLEQEVFLNTLVDGDCLVIERIDKDRKWLSYQIIDGSSVCTPPLNTGLEKDKDTRIIDGVEIDSKGRHVAYWVKSSALNPKENNIMNAFEYKRILAISKTTKRRKAFMVYGTKYRSSETRGLPLVGVCMQKAKQIDRYAKSEIATAEINSKFVATIKHNELSSGDNPLKKTILKSRNNRMVNAPEAIVGSPSDLSGDLIAQKTAKAVNGVVVNLGLGQELKSYDTNRPSINFTLFFDVNVKYLCAACEVPFEVALMVFGNNFSASRASLKMFEEILVCKRNNFAEQFNQPVYESFLLYYSALGYIDAQDLLEAYEADQHIVLESFFRARFFGKPIPHVDPKKEVEASILKIDNGLSTHEKETEILGMGDFEENALRLAREKLLFKKEMPQSGFNDKDNDEDDDEDEDEDTDGKEEKQKKGEISNGKIKR